MVHGSRQKAARAPGIPFVPPCDSHSLCSVLSLLRPEGEWPSPAEALQHVAAAKRVPMERLTIPSQRRYLSYFSGVMDGVRPRSEPLLLRRVIMNTIPTFGVRDGTPLPPGEGGAAAAAAAAGGSAGGLGCCPYVQVFKGGSLIFTATYK